MIEYLALPAWNSPPVSLDSWVAKLSETGGPVVVTRESSTVTWLEIVALQLRGYAIVESGHATAINFELHALDPVPATRALEQTVDALGWEIHADDDQDEEDEEDDE